MLPFFGLLEFVIRICRAKLTQIEECTHVSCSDLGSYKPGSLEGATTSAIL